MKYMFREAGKSFIAADACLQMNKHPYQDLGHYQPQKPSPHLLCVLESGHYPNFWHQIAFAIFENAVLESHRGSLLSRVPSNILQGKSSLLLMKSSCSLLLCEVVRSLSAILFTCPSLFMDGDSQFGTTKGWCKDPCVPPAHKYMLPETCVCVSVCTFTFVWTFTLHLPAIGYA